MNALANPMVLKIALAIALGVVAIVVLAFGLRLLRQSMLDDGTAQSGKSKSSDFDVTLATYQGVIQQFKAQGQELERLRQQDRQRASTTENISDAVISNLTSGVVLFSPMGLVQQANPAAKKILGYASPYSLHARDVFRGAKAIRPAAEDNSLPQILDRAAKTREAVHRLEVDYTTPAGESRVLGITISPVQDRGGMLLGTACLVSDLTEMSNMGQQVRLQDNMASLGEMSAGIAHEFKNSLATISGYSQMLAADSNPETREFAQKIALETGNLTRIVTDFLNFARPRGMQREPLDLRAMLEDCARENSVALTMESVPSPCTVEADPTALRQVFSNLMRNSKEAEVAGKTIAIQASTEEKGDQIVVRVSDNGSGIPQEKLPKIFIPFFTTKADGTGLGLALVHRIVTDHGGAVSVTSSEAGTTFSISLPRKSEPTANSAV